MNEIIRDFTEEDLLPKLPEVADGSALALYTKQDADGNPIGVAPILTDLRQRIDAWLENGHTVETKAGRAAIKSFAHIVTKAKSKVKAVGKELADEQKLVPKKIDAARRLLENTIEAWHDEIRQPLTDWEAAEKARVEYYQSLLRHIEDCARGFIGGQPQPIGLLLRELEEKIVIDASWGEFENEGRLAKDVALEKVRAALDAEQKRAAQEAELEALRAEKAERDRKDNEERLRKEGEERARLEAEADARAEKERAERKLADEKAAAERRERELIAEKEAAEQRAVEAAAKAKRELEDKKRAEEAEIARREADKAHKAKINRVALAAFVEGGIDPEVAKAVIKLIAAKAIPAISIHY